MNNIESKFILRFLAIIIVVSFSISDISAQSQSVTVRVNHLPVIVPKTPSSGTNTYYVCEYAPLNLKTLYVSEIDTNNTALADDDYTLLFSTSSDFNNPITGPDYSFTLSGIASQTIYVRVIMNNTLGCMNDSFSFVLNAQSKPAFTTQPIATCYGVNVDLNSAIQSLTDAGTDPLKEFSTDSSHFVAITNPENYDATVLGGSNGGDYVLYARVTNTDTNSGCHSSIVPFILHVDTMPTFILTASATSGTTEVCDGTTINLESYISSVSPSSGTTLEFSINDTTFTNPLSGLAATNYTLMQNNELQTPLVVYVRAKMNSTGCVGTNTAVQHFALLINPMPTLTVEVNADSVRVCDATSVNLEDYVVSYTSGATLQFSETSDFSNIIEGSAATSYSINLSNTIPQNLLFYVRAKMTVSGCVTMTDSVKNFTLEVHPAPVPQTITSGLSNGCSNNTIVYEIPLQTDVTYTWSAIGGTLTGSTTSKDSVTWGTVNAAAQVQVVYTLTTNNIACQRTATLGVDVRQSPTDVNLSIVSGSGETCDDGINQIQLRVDVTDGTLDFTIDYSWAPDNGNSSVTTSGNTTLFNVTPPNVGINYTYTINKVTDANGCQLILP